MKMENNEKEYSVNAILAEFDNERPKDLAQAKYVANKEELAEDNNSIDKIKEEYATLNENNQMKPEKEVEKEEKEDDR